MHATAHERIIVALDVEEIEAAERLVRQLGDQVGAFKIGKQLFTRYGPAVVEMVHAHGGRVFLDLKYHDIPATVARAAREAVRLGVWMFNVHALGGAAMMRAAGHAAREMAAQRGVAPPILLAVTVLTSMTAQDLQPLGITLPVPDLVAVLARQTRQAGLDGVVASAREVALIRQACGRDCVVVTPGVRPAGSQANDQKRTMTPGDAVWAGADYLVVGRPITAAPDPLTAAAAIGAEIAAAGQGPS